MWFGETLKEAVDRPRLHHQLQPDRLRHGADLPAGIVTPTQTGARPATTPAAIPLTSKTRTSDKSVLFVIYVSINLIMNNLMTISLV